MCWRKYLLVLLSKGINRYDDDDQNKVQVLLGPGIVFSPNGEHVAYVIGETDGRGPFRWSRARMAVVVDGQPQAWYDEVEQPVFSPDSRHVAYAACYAKRWMMVVDGKAGADYTGFGGERSAKPEPRRIVFSPDGVHYAYVAKGYYGFDQLVVDGKEEKTYEQISDLTYSADGKRLAFIAWNDYRWHIILDGKDIAQYDDATTPTFSPDGKRFAYAAKDNTGWHAVIDGNAGPGYLEAQSPVFSPDSRRTAYLAKLNVPSGEPAYFMVIDGKPTTARYLYLFEPVFSPDSRRLWYNALKPGKPLKSVLVLDGREIPGGYTPLFSPNGVHLAYVQSEKDKHSIIIDGKSNPAPTGSIRTLPRR